METKESLLDVLLGNRELIKEMEEYLDRVKEINDLYSTKGLFNKNQEGLSPMALIKCKIADGIKYEEEIEYSILMRILLEWHEKKHLEYMKSVYKDFVSGLGKY